MIFSKLNVRMTSLCIGAIILMVSCEKKKTLIQKLPKDKTLFFYVLTEPPTLDWNKASDTTSNTILRNIMSGLVEYEFSNGNIFYKPGLAKKIESQNEGQTWIFSLREDVYWSDGVPFEAQHIIDGWERSLNPQTASSYSYFLYHIKNAKEYNTGKIKDFSKVGVHITPDGKLKVELTDSKYFFPLTLIHSTTYPIRKDVIQNHGAKWTEAENIVTLGPYLLDAWKHDQFLILKKNPSYYGKFPGNADNVSIRIMSEVTTAFNVFETKKIDMIHTIPSKMIPAVKKRPDYVTFPTPQIAYYGLNVRIPPMNNKKFRQALNLAIDRSEFKKFMPNQNPLSSIIPVSIFGHNPSLGFSFNPQKARRLIQEIGGIQSIPKISIYFNTFEELKTLAENVQAQWKRNLSLDVEVRNEEWKTYLNRLQNLDSDSNKNLRNSVYVYRMGWVPDYPDPMTYMNIFISNSNNNYSGWKNQKYDELVLKASVLKNTSERQLILDEAQKVIIEESPIIPFFQGSKSLLLSPRIKKFPLEHLIMEHYIFKDVILR